MKFEGIGFNDKHLKGMSREEFDMNVAHCFPEHPEKIEELYSIIHGNDKKPAGQVEEIEHRQDASDEPTADPSELH